MKALLLNPGKPLTHRRSLLTNASEQSPFGQNVSNNGPLITHYLFFFEIQLMQGKTDCGLLAL